TEVGTGHRPRMLQRRRPRSPVSSVPESSLPDAPETAGTHQIFAVGTESHVIDAIAVQKGFLKSGLARDRVPHANSPIISGCGNALSTWAEGCMPDTGIVLEWRK